MKKTTVFLLAIASMAASCSKDTHAVASNGTYVSTGSATVDNAIMYTPQGIVTDQNQIKAVLTGNNNTFFSFGDGAVKAPFAVKLEYNDANTVSKLTITNSIYGMRDTSFQVTAAVTSSKDLLFTAVDSSSLYVISGGGFAGGVITISSIFPEKDTVFTALPLTGGLGIIGKVSYLQKYPVKVGGNGELYIKVLTAFVSNVQVDQTGTPISSNTSSLADRWAIYDMHGFGQLKQGQTVILQEKTIPLTRQ